MTELFIFFAAASLFCGMYCLFLPFWDHLHQ